MAPSKASRRENRRKARRRVPRVWYIGAFLLVVGLGGALDVGWSLLARYATAHPYFSLGEIVVEADGRFSQEEIQTWASLAPGMNLWEIDPAQIETRLLAHPWVRTTEVRREFPRRVHVTVGMRRPVAIILRSPLTYVDETGACFVGRHKSDPLDLPYVSGLAGLALDTPTARTALAGVLQLLSLARLWQDPLSEIHWDRKRGYTLFLAYRRAAIHLGWEITPEKFAQVGSVLELWPADGPGVLFDARFTDQVVVRPYARARGENVQTAIRPL
ncbi:MAG: cell division protein FtsQ/DivIB [Candidatus Binatia bacterium]